MITLYKKIGISAIIALSCNPFNLGLMDSSFDKFIKEQM